MPESDRYDAWAEGDGYELYIGRWSRPVAREFLEWLSVPVDADWVDVGCGTGALSQEVLEHCDPGSVIGVDLSARFIEFARGRVDSPKVVFAVGDAQALPLGSGAADAVVSGLALNFVPDPVGALREMARVSRTGGTVAVYVWDYAEGMDLIRVFWDAAIALDPKASVLDEGRRFPICHPDELAAGFADAGLEGVEARPIEVPTPFQGFEGYWVPFLTGQGPAPGYLMSLEPAERDALKRRLLSILSPDVDGVIALTARAWAVRGTVSWADGISLRAR